MAFRTVLVGGYGTFGARIARELAADDAITLVVAGRSLDRAQALAGQWRGVEAAWLDVASPRLDSSLAALSPDLVIHAAGPFQARGYEVARAALAAGAHYVDIADGRAFVNGILALDGAARAANRLVVSGASSVPGISLAAVKHLAATLARVDSVDVGISPGNRAPRGEATVAAILGYVGRPFPVWRSGAWRTAHGWQRLRRERYPAPVGTRWLADCDVPDLDLLPRQYPALTDATFGAGLELRRMHFGLRLLASLVRLGVVRDLPRHARRLIAMSTWWIDAGTDTGAMHVRVRGIDAGGRARTRTWAIVAQAGDGPQIPATPAVVVAKKLARGALDVVGARPCIDLFDVDECMAALASYRVRAAVGEVD